MLTVIVVNAVNGAKKVYHFITDKTEKKPPEANEKSDKKPPDHTGSIASADEDDSEVGTVSRQTLSPEDLQMEWQAPTAEAVPVP